MNKNKELQTEYPLEQLFGRILSPFERFLRQTTAGGIVLMGTTMLTLLVANSRWGGAFQHFWDQPLDLRLGAWQLDQSLHHLVNDGLMALFFLLVGLELKREMLVGELSSLRDAVLPVVAAIGGMLIPALIYLAFNPEGPSASGWGIPMATDIAFAVGILVLLAWRIPRNLIVFLTALAIADDLGAVLVIALFYTAQLDYEALGFGAAILTVLVLLNRGGIRHPLPYGLLGISLWLALLHSGVHATLAGIFLAFAIPARSYYTPQQFERRLEKLTQAFRSETVNPETPDDPLSNHRMATIAESLEEAANAVQAPLQRMEHALQPWVAFGVIPVFALANAGIDFGEIQLAETLAQPVTIGVILGLVLGKFIGIGATSWLAVRLGIGRLPTGVEWRHIFGAAWLGGVGFTMSLFINQLAFPEAPWLLEQARFGILAASAISAVMGLIWLYFSSAHIRKATESIPDRSHW
jgi:Na+:H+ antiporter, NhaA family